MPTSKQVNDAVRDSYHAWLSGRRGGRLFVYCESYVKTLCRYITLEIRAGRMFWSYDLPSDAILNQWFKAYREMLAAQWEKLR